MRPFFCFSHSFIPLRVLNVFVCHMLYLPRVIFKLQNPFRSYRLVSIQLCRRLYLIFISHLISWSLRGFSSPSGAMVASNPMSSFQIGRLVIAVLLRFFYRAAWEQTTMTESNAPGKRGGRRSGPSGCLGKSYDYRCRLAGLASLVEGCGVGGRRQSRRICFDGYIGGRELFLCLPRKKRRCRILDRSIWLRSLLERGFPA